MDQNFKIVSKEIIKKHERRTDNPTISMHVSKKETGIIFKIKTGYYLGLLTPETMKLLGSTEKKLKIEIEKVCLITKLIN